MRRVSESVRQMFVGEMLALIDSVASPQGARLGDCHLAQNIAR
jgi:hypothetical protein